MRLHRLSPLPLQCLLQKARIRMASKAILFSYTNYPGLTANLEGAGVKMSKDSMLRHGSFTFDLQGISRAASHQIVRHRIASFSQQCYDPETEILTVDG